MSTKPTLTQNPIESWLHRGDQPYPAIHLFIRIALIVSWLGLIAGGITGLVIFIAGLVAGHGFVSFFLMLVLWAVSMLWWIGFRVVPELLQIVVHIEDHLQVLRNASAGDSSAGIVQNDP
ncbi:MAG: hypothetical protein M1415_03815 [Firmicutes bacterium]|nr:hypothetical protein [Bacillota bacterium]MCL5066262.1 hypothetical protein [Bacillota bacterium]